MTDAKPKKIMLSGGGTGGSVTPLLVFAAAYRQDHPAVSFVFVGSGPLERELVAEAQDIPFISIISGKWRRYFSLHNLLDIFKVSAAFFQSLFIIIKERPALLMTAGSFVSVPLSLAAYILHIPIFVHQQDIQPGLANRLMAPMARRITVVFEKSLADYGTKAVWTGNPMSEAAWRGDREEVFRRYGLDPQHPLIIAFGGGTGAKGINDLIVAGLPTILKRSQVVLITGPGKALDLGKEERKGYEMAGYREFERVSHEEISEIMGISAIAISRAGLGALTGLSRLAKPAILIPMPDSHQEDNALVFAEAKAAIVLDQAALDGNLLAKEIFRLLDDAQLCQSLSANISRLMKKDANVSISQLVSEVIDEK